MPATVVFSRRARRELEAILDYIEAEAGPIRADTVADRITQALTTLETLPYAGHPKSNRLGFVRLFVVKPWNVYYRTQRAGSEVRILRIVDGRRHLKKLLGD
jgi:plasmid stabilization system protein ParE